MEMAELMPVSPSLTVEEEIQVDENEALTTNMFILQNVTVKSQDGNFFYKKMKKLVNKLSND